MDHTHIRAYFLAAVTTLLAILTVYMLGPFLVTVGLAAVFAIIFSPISRRLEKRLPRGPAAFLTLLVAMACLAIPLIFLGTQLFREAQDLYSLATQPNSIAHAQQALITLGDRLDTKIPGAHAYFTGLSSRLNVYVHQSAGMAVGYIGTIFSRTLSFILHLFVFLMTMYYFLKEGPRVKQGLERFSPLSKTETAQLFDRIVRTTSSIMSGTILIAIVQGVLTAIGFGLFGISNPVLWGAIAIFAALVPGIGVALVVAPAVLFLLFTGHVGSGIGLALFGVLVIGTIDNLLKPFVLGSRASIHPLLILLSVLGGISFFGAPGIFLGPLVISILLGLLSLYAPSQREASEA